MQAQLKGGQMALMLTSLLIIFKVIQASGQARRNRPIKAPEWARELWSLVPAALLNSLTWADWKGMQAMQASRVKEFGARAAVEAFRRHHRIVLSCTTSPLRIKWLALVLRLLDTDCVDEIAINLPRRFGRNQQTYGEIPDELASMGKVKVHWYDADPGPIMKILNTVEREQGDPDTMCISIDDDIAYPPNLLWSLATASVALGGAAVVGAKGAMMRRFVTGVNAQSEVSFFESLWPAGAKRVDPIDGIIRLDLIEGYGGVAYRVKHLDPPRLREMSSCDKKCFQSDDVVLNMQMQQTGVQRMMISGVAVKPFSFGNQEDALHVMQNHYDAYGRCIKFVKSK